MGPNMPGGWGPGGVHLQHAAGEVDSGGGLHPDASTRLHTPTGPIPLAENSQVSPNGPWTNQSHCPHNSPPDLQAPDPVPSGPGTLARPSAGQAPALCAEASPGWKLWTRRRPEWVRALPAQAPHQHQAVLAAREEVAAVPCELQAGDVLVVAAQDDQEVPCGDLGKAGHTQVRAGHRVSAWSPGWQVTEVP